MHHMKEFSFLVRVPVSYTSAQAATVNSKWNALIEKWKQEGAYITSFPFPGEGYIISGEQKTVKKGIVISDELKVVSNIFLKSETMESAIELAKAFPILEFGGSVELREIPARTGAL